ncbi:uncharacterized protein VTP21DRAFT_10283 [Calcarisporiella thermophila]|uniref:uncharacterized protein n=1 Tax=Calcarisporiella thermophila TaxID=911321 RepID=UPI0037432915
MHQTPYDPKLSAQNVPRTLGQLKYSLEVVQQPQRCRMCGFGDKDRRPITPPPIVRLRIVDAVGNPVEIKSQDTSFFIAICDLWSVDKSKQQNLVLHPAAYSEREYTSTRNLIGSLVSSALKLHDLDGKLGIYFVFQDLSVRTEGSFRLKFSFAEVGGHEAVSMGVSRVHAEIFTDPFTVYSAKKFPGMLDSTPLSRCFARQGVKIPVRKDQRRRASGKEGADDSEEEEEEEIVEEERRASE